MEREPEEYGDAEYGEEGVHALFQFLGHGSLFGLGILDCGGSFFLGGVGQAFLGG